jgi:hypothetical protein
MKITVRENRKGNKKWKLVFRGCINAMFTNNKSEWRQWDISINDFPATIKVEIMQPVGNCCLAKGHQRPTITIYIALLEELQFVFLCSESGIHKTISTHFRIAVRISCFFADNAFEEDVP